MEDFRCCGLILPSIHDLIQHYEKYHAHNVPTSSREQPTQPKTSSKTENLKLGKSSEAVRESAQESPPKDWTSNTQLGKPSIKKRQNSTEPKSTGRKKARWSKSQDKTFDGLQNTASEEFQKAPNSPTSTQKAPRRKESTTAGYSIAQVPPDNRSR